MTYLNIAFKIFAFIFAMFAVYFSYKREWAKAAYYMAFACFDLLIAAS